MSSETELVNAALRLVAGGRITSLAQGNKSANVATDLYTVIRDDMFRTETGGAPGGQNFVDGVGPVMGTFFQDQVPILERMRKSLK